MERLYESERNIQRHDGLRLERRKPESRFQDDTPIKTDPGAETAEFQERELMEMVGVSAFPARKSGPMT